VNATLYLYDAEPIRIGSLGIVGFIRANQLIPEGLNRLPRMRSRIMTQIRLAPCRKLTLTAVLCYIPLQMKMAN
jgi:hypothetical protein